MKDGSEEKTCVIVSCCAECPALTKEKKCGEDESDDVEIDPDFVEEDIPASCPMLGGHRFESEGLPVALAAWLTHNAPEDIES